MTCRTLLGSELNKWKVPVVNIWCRTLTFQKKFVLFASIKVFIKWWKMLCISPEKFFSFWSYLNFCLDFLIMSKNGSILMIWLISKFMMSRSHDHTPRSETVFGNWKPFKSDEKCFLFHLKSSFHYQNI